MLVAKTQYRRYCSELGDGSLTEINFDRKGKEYFTTYSLKYSDNIM